MRSWLLYILAGLIEIYSQMKYQFATINRSWCSTLDKNLNVVYGRTGTYGRTYARTDNPNAPCPRWTEAAGGIKTAFGAKRMPKQNAISNSKSISILGIPITDFRHNGKCNTAHFMKKSMHLKTGFLSDYQVLFLLLNGLQIEIRL